MQHAERLSERGARHGRHEHAVRAANRPLELGRRVLHARVDHHVGAQPGRHGELGIIDVDRDDVKAHGLRVLHGIVAEGADVGDRDPVGRFAFEHLQSLVRSDAGTEPGRDPPEVTFAGR